MSLNGGDTTPPPKKKNTAWNTLYMSHFSSPFLFIKKKKTDNIWQAHGGIWTPWTPSGYATCTQPIRITRHKDDTQTDKETNRQEIFKQTKFPPFFALRPPPAHLPPTSRPPPAHLPPPRGFTPIDDTVVSDATILNSLSFQSPLKFLCCLVNGEFGYFEATTVLGFWFCALSVLLWHQVPKVFSQNSSLVCQAMNKFLKI